MINEAHHLMDRTNTTIGHTYRTANQCTDYLARWGTKQDVSLVFLTEMPIAMREFVFRDSLNIWQVLD
ncbi:hypothetical protein RHMOL_Rhmol13G0243200 [Rhododendron molle]|uniref:Uncharacterized protein n=1 Tax=Rhododendron molle TaxID=49168 RepID=A0ACC0LAQ7_RHOML|nr:hypothetical protein RHMOL_Rhmol13G0243200 [Rhododendron molle]